MLQAGGTALGEISTRSSERSRAILRASKGGMTPSCSPFSSITRTSRARIRSLVRIKDFAERLSIGGISRLHSESSSLAMHCLGFRCNHRERLHRSLKYNTTNEIASKFHAVVLASLPISCMFARKLLERNQHETPHPPGR